MSSCLRYSILVKPIDIQVYARTQEGIDIRLNPQRLNENIAWQIGRTILVHCSSQHPLASWVDAKVPWVYTYIGVSN